MCLLNCENKSTEILNLANNQYVLAWSFLYLGTSHYFWRNRIQFHNPAFHGYVFQNVLLPRIKPASDFLFSAIYMDSGWNQNYLIKWKRFKMCVLRLFPDLSLWLRPPDSVHTQIILGEWWRLSLGPETKPREGAVVSSSGVLHSSEVRPVRFSISHELVLHLGPRQPSSLPLWEALWLRLSVMFLQRTINGAPLSPLMLL